MIYLNEKELDNLHIGDKEIEAVFLGDKEIWTNNPWYLLPLGERTGYDNVADLGYNPALLTAGNFVALGQPNHIHGYCEVVYSVATTSRVAYYIRKSYNPTTGKLEFYYQNYSRNIIESIPMQLYVLSHQKVPNAVKVKKKNVLYLGFAQSFNVKNVYEDYANLTENNFYLTSGNWSMFEDGPSETGAGPVEGYGWIAKSYDKNTGVLSFYNTSSPNNATGALGVWLIA